MRLGLVRMMTILRLIAAVLALGVLSACTGSTELPPVDQIARKAHVTGDAPSVTLVTMLSEKTGKGEHSALLIDGSERVLYEYIDVKIHSSKWYLLL